MSAMKAWQEDLSEAYAAGFDAGLTSDPVAYRDAILGAYTDAQKYAAPGAAMVRLLAEVESGREVAREMLKTPDFVSA